MEQSPLSPRIIKIKLVAKGIFFGNYFYGICAVALAIEATLQQRYPLNNSYFYLALFTATTWYYTKPYITSQTTFTSNPRTNWYIENKLFVKYSQLFLASTTAILGGFFLVNYWHYWIHISLTRILLLSIFPIAAILYYGVNHKIIGNLNIRTIGWLKPFVIGFIWAGLVTIYPILFYNIVHGRPENIDTIGWLLSLKNFMYVAVLCIMFDIKDYATDYNQNLQTFVVTYGLRKTIFYILIPLSIAGLGSFLIFGYVRGFSMMKLSLNTIPFLSMLAVAYSLKKRKNILYYLVLIDGLMLLKAICGILAMLYF